MAEKIKRHPVDVHVGARLRERRRFRDISQTALADVIGVTFQQVHKYEIAADRVSVSRLWQIAAALDVPVSFFFDGLPSPMLTEPGHG